MPRQQEHTPPHLAKDFLGNVPLKSPIAISNYLNWFKINLLIYAQSPEKRHASGAGGEAKGAVISEYPDERGGGRGCSSPTLETFSIGPGSPALQRM